MSRVGRFEILAELGQGAMGRVFRARDPVLDRMVAVKILAGRYTAGAEALMRFEREARAAARLSHPNIVTIYELGEIEGTHFIVMELLDGVDLMQAIEYPKLRLDFDTKLRILIEVCRALDYAHKRGVVHRDVKPANIRILENGAVKIVDFGIAHLTDSSMTQAGLVLGTPSYIAPEVLRSGRVDHRADIWAVGVILYELLAGRRPFDAPTVPALINSIIRDATPRLDVTRLGVPLEIGRIVQHTLAKEPGERYREASKLADDLEALRHEHRETETISDDERGNLCAVLIDRARALLDRNDLDGALEAARQAQALDPTRNTIVALIDAVESRLCEAPTIVSTPLNDARAEDSSVGAGPVATAPQPARLLDDCRRKGSRCMREVTIFGDGPSASAACLSPRRDLVATSGSDGAIRIWSLTSRDHVVTLRSDLHQRTGHDALARAIAFAPDGRLLASGHVDGAVHLWDLGRGLEIPVRLRHDGSIGDIVFSPDGAMLVSGAHDATIKFWDVRAAWSGDARRALYRQPSAITALAFAGGSTWLVTGHVNRILRVLDVATGRLVATLRGPESAVSQIRTSPDGRTIAVASQDRVVRIFDLAEKRQVTSVESPRRPPSGLAFFSAGSALASVSRDNALCLWDLDRGALLASLWGAKQERFVSVFFPEEETSVAVLLADGRIRLWSRIR